ncbi:MAG: hypothetical protein SFW62_03200 [Alphaproteobacteria bacterium]|nr:hypothetical protein [Alphaproteobacteria bacterium]
MQKLKPFASGASRLFALSLMLAGFGIACPQVAFAQGYTDADILLSSVLGKLQYPIPRNATPTADNRLSFANATAGTSTAPGEVDFVAAHRFCEHLAPVFPTPPHGTNRKITLDDVLSISIERNNAAFVSAAVDECFAALTYRTSCPTSSTAALRNSSGNCHDDQVTACNRLKNSPAGNPKGMGISSIGDPEADHALANCTENGLSPAMYDKILAYRCDSDGYVTGALSNIQSDAIQWERTLQFDCPALKQAFDEKLYLEKQRLLTAIQNLVLIRGLGAKAPNPTARHLQP